MVRGSGYQFTTLKPKVYAFPGGDEPHSYLISGSSMIHQTAGSELENMFIVLAYYFINLCFFKKYYLGERKTEGGKGSWQGDPA